MSFEPDFLSLMADTVTIKPRTSLDQYGAPSFGDSVDVPGNVTYRLKVIRTDVEDKALSTAQLQIPPPGYVVNDVTVPRVASGDEITLSDDDVTRHVISSIVYTDDTGDHHQTIALT